MGLSVVTLLGLAVGAVVVGDRIAEDWAIDDAQLREATVARAVVGPLVDEQVRAGDAARARAAGRHPARRDGRGVDQAREAVDAGGARHLVGRAGGHRAALPARRQRARPLRTEGVTAGVSTLDNAENIADRDEGSSSRSTPGSSTGGRPLVVEAYLSTAQMRAEQRTILVALLTVAVGVLIAYQLAVVPLAVGLARRVERGQEQQAQVLRRSLLATHRERLRIAHDLHDGVVQDLAGLTYAMPLVADQLPSTPEASMARQTVADATEMLARDVEALRSMLIDIHPPDLEGDGLAEAARDLAERVESSGITVQLDVPESPDWALGTSRLVYRTLQEGVAQRRHPLGRLPGGRPGAPSEGRGPRRGERRRPRPGRGGRAAARAPRAAAAARAPRGLRRRVDPAHR